MIPFIDTFIASEFYYDEVFSNRDYEASCRKLIEMGPEIAVITLGSKGCVGVDKNGYFEQATFNDVKVVDTVGAGDVFHGAFLYGLLQGWGAAKTSRFANAVSSIKCSRIGGRAGIPDYKTVADFLETGKIDYAEIDERTYYYRRGVEHVFE
jgi:sulfofructose kinase